MTNPEISLKLLVDKSSKNVVYAEAEKEFVNFLFGLLELPLGSLMVLLNNRGRIAPSSFVKVYESVRNLGSSYFATSNTKHSLLKPNLPSSNVHHTPLLQELTYTKPASCCSYYANTPKKDVDGHVKGLVTCMVMDDLSLKPLSSISRITVLNTRKVKDVSRLEEKIVNVDIEKVLFLHTHLAFGVGEGLL